MCTQEGGRRIDWEFGTAVVPAVVVAEGATVVVMVRVVAMVVKVIFCTNAHHRHE